MVRDCETLIIRHPREKLAKCSLLGLEERPDLHFVQFEREEPPRCDGSLLLGFEGPRLSRADRDRPLLLIDGTWRLAGRIMRGWAGHIEAAEPRSIPSDWVTAYPRRQPDCPAPSRGLASVEALFIAYFLTGRAVDGLLEHYHWKDEFLELNRARLGVR